MKQTIKALLLSVGILSAAPAFSAEQTWSAIGTSLFSVKGVCAAASPMTCDAPSDATKGMSLAGVFRVKIVVCAIDNQTITDGDGLDVYFYRSDATATGLTASWAISDIVLKVTKGVGKKCAEVQPDISGVPGLVLGGNDGRMAVVPNAMATSSGALAVFMYAYDSMGRPL